MWHHNGFAQRVWLILPFQMDANWTLEPFSYSPRSCTHYQATMSTCFWTLAMAKPFLLYPTACQDDNTGYYVSSRYDVLKAFAGPMSTWFRSALTIILQPGAITIPMTDEESEVSTRDSPPAWPSPQAVATLTTWTTSPPFTLCSYVAGCLFLNPHQSNKLDSPHLLLCVCFFPLPLD